MKTRRPRKNDQEWPNKELEIQQKRANLAKYCPEEQPLDQKFSGSYSKQTKNEQKWFSIFYSQDSIKNNTKTKWLLKEAKKLGFTNQWYLFLWDNYH